MLSAENCLLKKLTELIFFLICSSTRRISHIEKKLTQRFIEWERERNKCECKELEQILSLEGGREEGGQQSITNDGDFVISIGDLFFLDFLQRSFPTFSIYSSIRRSTLIVIMCMWELVVWCENDVKIILLIFCIHGTIVGIIIARQCRQKQKMKRSEIIE